jgi:ribosome-associated protein
MIRITPALAIDETEISESFVRASGPGGQNVNKVSTAVELRFDALGSPNLPEEVKAKLRTVAGRRMTKDGVVVLLAQRFRTQEANRMDALARLVDMIAEAAVVQAVRRPTRPTRASQRRRVESKVKRGAVKRTRTDRPEME